MTTPKGKPAGRKPDRVETALRALRDDPSSKTVEEALRSTIGVVVGAAAAHADAHGLVAELAPAFVRLCEQGSKRDPGCRGKVAIARTLHELERWEDDVFERGVRYVQDEPVFGGSVDTAAELRGICAIAHAQFARSDALDVCATVLADKERTARVGAAKALGDSGRIDAAALLRFKILVGDDEGEVLQSCFESLFALAPERAAPFAIGCLAGHDDLAEIAALALGTSRSDQAFAAIVSWSEAALPAQRGRVGYLALALMRSEQATAYLVDTIRQGEPRDAIAAAKALATFKDDTALLERIHQAARKQPDKAARTAIAQVGRTPGA